MKYSCSLSKRRAGRDPRSCGAGLNPKRPRTGDNSPKENTWARHRVISRKEPTSTAKLRMTLSTYRAIQSTRTPSLPHLYACAQPAFRTLFTPTDEFDAPSVRKDMQPENTKSAATTRVPAFYLASIEPAHIDACVCVRAWFESGEVQKRQKGSGRGGPPQLTLSLRLAVRD